MVVKWQNSEVILLLLLLLETALSPVMYFAAHFHILKGLEADLKMSDFCGYTELKTV